jgi:nucleotide-binding universal stress UspA family protein
MQLGSPELPTGRKTLALRLGPRESSSIEETHERNGVSMFTNILLAVDTSERSRKAVSTAAELARSTGGAVHVIHVRPLLATGRGGPQDVDMSELEHNVAEDVCQELQSGGIEATFSRVASYHGDTGHKIVEAAQERTADLIVVGSRGHSEIPSVLLGSVAHKVVHLADCPVLIVR